MCSSREGYKKNSCAAAEEDIKQQDREECNPWERPPAPHQSPLTILLFRRLHHPSSILSTSFIPYSISSILLLCPSLILLNRKIVATSTFSSALISQCSCHFPCRNGAIFNSAFHPYKCPFQRMTAWNCVVWWSYPFICCIYLSS